MGRRRTAWLMVGMLLACPALAIADRPTDLWDTVTKTATSTSAQTDTALWTPASGKRIALQGCLISSEYATVVEVEVSDVDVVPPIYLTSLGSVLIGGDGTLLYRSAKDAVLTYTTSANAPSYGRVSIMCWGYEVE